MSDVTEYMIPCMNKSLFGVDCPGCGIQRSAVMVAQGDFAGAYEMYPAIFTLILMFGVIGLNYFFKIKYGTKIIVGLAIINVTVIMISYITKMNIINL